MHCVIAGEATSSRTETAEAHAGSNLAQTSRRRAQQQIYKKVQITVTGFQRNQPLRHFSAELFFLATRGYCILFHHD